MPGDSLRDKVAEAMRVEDRTAMIPRAQVQRMADAAIAAIRPTIITIEQLDALPVGSVVRDARPLRPDIADVAQKGHLAWFFTADGCAADVGDVPLPAIVLWTPEADQ